MKIVIHRSGEVDSVWVGEIDNGREAMSFVREELGLGPASENEMRQEARARALRIIAESIDTPGQMANVVANAINFLDLDSKLSRRRRAGER